MLRARSCFLSVSFVCCSSVVPMTANEEFLSCNRTSDDVCKDIKENAFYNTTDEAP